VRVFDLRDDPDASLVAVADHIRRGGLVAYPTETVYGIGGACTPEAADRVRALKGRGDTKPLIALVPDRDAVRALEWTSDAEELAEIFWPGSVTLVLRDPDGLFPDGVRDSGRGTVGVRVSPHPIASRLVSELGEPLTSTSLNRSGEAPITSGSDARTLLENLEATDVWLLDAGTLPPSAPSTVVDCTGRSPRVLREGAIPTGRLRCAIPEIDG
jgi:L-threonylcarbamoyladenylate synthase